MKQIYSVRFLDRHSGKVLRTFHYPAYKVRSKFFWEKLKAEQLLNLTRVRQIDSYDVIVEDFSSVN